MAKRFMKVLIGIFKNGLTWGLLVLLNCWILYFPVKYLGYTNDKQIGILFILAIFMTSLDEILVKIKHG